MKNKHLVFFSGGAGSWYVAELLKQKHGTENLYLQFSDTLAEDKDLYRFLLESISDIYEIPREKYQHLVELAHKIPEPYESRQGRKDAISHIREEYSKLVPNLYWLTDGRDLWDVYFDNKYIGNGRISICSKELKQKTAKRTIKKEFSPDDTIMYLGIDWTEAHRTKGSTKGWAPFEVQYPLVEDLSFNKVDMFKLMESKGIATPQLYKEGAIHNNCSMFCVRMGQGGFREFLEKRPKLYAYHEEMEQKAREFIGKDVAILRKQKTHKTKHKPIATNWEEINNKPLEQWEIDYFEYMSKEENNKNPYTVDYYEKVLFGWTDRRTDRIALTMKMLREDVEKNGDKNIDLQDIGGCGCFLMEEDE